MQLRPYQERALADVRRAFATHQRVLLQLPTGGGKTVIMSEITRLAIEKLAPGEKVLILVHRDELIRQTYDKLCAFDVRAGCISGGAKFGRDAPVHVASVQTMSRDKWLAYFRYGLILTDEAHHACASTYVKIYQHYPNARHLGFTATPFRADGKGLRTAKWKGADVPLFDCLVCGPTIKELIAAGALVPSRTVGVRINNVDTSNFKISKGEYNAEDMEQAYGSRQALAEIVAAYRDITPGRRAIVFAVSVEHSIQLKAAFDAAGIPAAHVDGQTPLPARQLAFQRFGTGEVKVLCNVAIATEGTDIPGIDVVILARSTKSLGLLDQMRGRAFRPAPGKTEAVIIDCGQNTEEHGLPDEDRYLTLDGLERKGRNMPETKEKKKQTEDRPPTFFSDSTDYTKYTHNMPRMIQFVIEAVQYAQDRGHKVHSVIHRLRDFAEQRRMKLTAEHLALVCALTNTPSRMVNFWIDAEGFGLARFSIPKLSHAELHNLKAEAKRFVSTIAEPVQ